MEVRTKSKFLLNIDLRMTINDPIAIGLWFRRKRRKNKDERFEILKVKNLENLKENNGLISIVVKSEENSKKITEKKKYKS